MATNKPSDPLVVLALNYEPGDDADPEHPRQWIVNLLGRYSMDREYRGDFEERVRLHQVTSVEVGQVIEGDLAIEWHQVPESDQWEPRIRVSDRTRLRLAFFKRLIWRYVISGGQLAQQQEGQRKTIRFLMRYLSRTLATGTLIRAGLGRSGSPGEAERMRRLIPASFSVHRRHVEEDAARVFASEIAECLAAYAGQDPAADGDHAVAASHMRRDLLRQIASSRPVLRLSADVVASLTDGQALSLASRLRNAMSPAWTMDGEVA